MKNSRRKTTYELEQLAEQHYKDLEEIQKVLKARASFSIVEDLNQIKSITDNYNMGMLTQIETMKQISDIATSSIKEFENL